ncbi:MAG: ABC transporter permease [Actinobacteria bacterium]|nr:ABC transporter permease [Actinomycetota bacterium]
MLLHLVKDSLMRRRRRVAVATVSLLLGTALVSALLSVSMDIEDKVGREMSSFGANIILEPTSDAVPVEISGIPVGQVGNQAYLKDTDLPKLKGIFWKNNVQAFAPFLYGNVSINGEQATLAGTWFDQELPVSKGSSFRTGVEKTSPWWQVEGDWPGGDGQALVGRELAQRLGVSKGDTLNVVNRQLRQTLAVSGIVSTGGFEDWQLFVNLPEAQSLLSLPGAVSKVQISALTKPPDNLAHRAELLGDPHDLPKDDYEKWYCSPYVGSITYQINEAFPDGQAKVVRQVADAEGAFLGKLKLLFALIAGVTVATSALGVTATMSTTVMERRTEIGLMKALGAENFHIAGQLLLEAGFSGLIGGISGYGLGLAIAALISREVFDTPASINLLVFPLSLILALAIALIGSALPVRRAIRIHPSEALTG